MVIDTTKQYTRKELIANIRACIGIEGKRLPTKSLNLNAYNQLPKAKLQMIGLLITEFMQLEQSEGKAFISPSVDKSNGELFHPFNVEPNKAPTPEKKQKPKEEITLETYKALSQDVKDNLFKHAQYLVKIALEKEYDNRHKELEDFYKNLPISKAVEQLVQLNRLIPDSLTDEQVANYRLKTAELYVQLAVGVEE